MEWSKVTPSAPPPNKGVVKEMNEGPEQQQLQPLSAVSFLLHFAMKAWNASSLLSFVECF
jgi:hypothetical protein